MSKPLCVICYEDSKSEDGFESPSCGHIFHSLCLQQWMEYSKGNSDCPTCRSKFTKNEIRKLFFTYGNFKGECESIGQSQSQIASQSENLNLTGDELVGEKEINAKQFSCLKEMLKKQLEINDRNAKKLCEMDIMKVNFENEKVNFEEKINELEKKIKEGKEEYENILKDINEELKNKQCILNNLQNENDNLKRKEALYELKNNIDLSFDQIEEFAKKIINNNNNINNKKDNDNNNNDNNNNSNNNKNEISIHSYYDDDMNENLTGDKRMISMLQKLLAERNESYKSLILKCYQIGHEKEEWKKKWTTSKTNIKTYKTRIGELETALKGLQKCPKNENNSKNDQFQTGFSQNETQTFVPSQKNVASLNLNLKHEDSKFELETKASSLPSFSSSSFSYSSSFSSSSSLPSPSSFSPFDGHFSDGLFLDNRVCGNVIIINTRKETMESLRQERRREGEGEGVEGKETMNGGGGGYKYDKEGRGGDEGKEEEEEEEEETRREVGRGEEGRGGRRREGEGEDGKEWNECEILSSLPSFSNTHEDDKYMNGKNDDCSRFDNYIDLDNNNNNNNNKNNINNSNNNSNNKYSDNINSNSNRNSNNNNSNSNSNNMCVHLGSKNKEQILNANSIRFNARDEEDGGEKNNYQSAKKEGKKEEKKEGKKEERRGSSSMSSMANASLRREEENDDGGKFIKIVYDGRGGRRKNLSPPRAKVNHKIRKVQGKNSLDNYFSNR